MGKKFFKKSLSFWRNVVFSDESSFELHGSGRVYVRRPPGHRCNPKYTIKTTGGVRKKLMVWGGIREDGERILVRITGTVNSDKYIQILKDHLLDFMYLGDFFQQDNAPPHKSEKTSQFFAESCVDVLENWPPQSPDLNIIENLWSILKRRVQRRKPSSEEELWSVLYDKFFKIPTLIIKNLYKSVQKRLKCVLVNKGASTKY